MTFRQATLDDEGFFWHRRVVDERKGQEGGWYLGQITDKEEHHRWFVSRLTGATMLVWLRDGLPAGTVRIDSNGEVAFSARPNVVVDMLVALKLYAAGYGGRLKVTVDSGNRPAVLALHAAGFEEYEARFFCHRL